MRYAMLIVLVVVMSGCKKPEPPKPVAKKDDAPPVAAPVDERNTNFQPGGGAVQNVRQAVKRTVALVDLDQLGKLIAGEELQNGRMPTAADIKLFLKKDAPKILGAIEDGTLILTDTKSRSGLWAYEIDADKAGGLVLVGGTARRADAEEAKQLLAAK
jgi:hypothetical protein